MSVSISRWFGDWRHLVDKPISAEDAERAVEQGSIPAFAFYFMLALSAVIATLGLLANSAAVIIGAMIVAPLMNPIISMSFGLVAGRGALTMRSLLSVFSGTLLTIGVAFVFTEAIGWKPAGSEIVARMKPSLLDLGVAVAAGAAAAFAYTRPSVIILAWSNTLRELYIANLSPNSRVFERISSAYRLAISMKGDMNMLSFLPYNSHDFKWL